MWRAKVAVGYEDLFRSALFRSPYSVVSFLDFYHLYHFLEAPTVFKHGKSQPLSIYVDWNAGGTFVNQDSAILAQIIIKNIDENLRLKCVKLEERFENLERINDNLEKLLRHALQGQLTDIISEIGQRPRERREREQRLQLLLPGGVIPSLEFEHHNNASSPADGCRP